MPLGGDGIASRDVGPRDLSVFWEQCESVLCGLGPKIEVVLLFREHIHRVGPLLLGQAVWKDIHDNGYRDLHEFKTLVEERFGMTETERHKHFCHMWPEVAEDFGRFVH